MCVAIRTTIFTFVKIGAVSPILYVTVYTCTNVRPLGIFAVLHWRTVISFSFTFIYVIAVIDAITFKSNITIAKKTSNSICTIAFAKDPEMFPIEPRVEERLMVQGLRVSLSFEMTIVGMFFAFIDIKAILPITNKTYPAFALECSVIIMALKWF